MTGEVTSCSGAPRDLGFDQGRACRRILREGVAQAGLRTARRRLPNLRPWSSGPILGAGLGREIIRHYPHISERMAGLALGADLPLESLVSYMEARTRSDSPVRRPARALAAAGSAPWLVRECPSSSGTSQSWTLRRSQPEVGFASVEVTVPWLASAVAGVNQAGLAAAIVVNDATAMKMDKGQGAIALLLIQECLQQFASLESCLDWCRKRPSACDARVLFADASGEIASIEMDRRERRVVRSQEGMLAEGIAGDALAAPAAEAGTVAGMPDWDSLQGPTEVSTTGPNGTASPRSAWVRLIPGERQLVWAGVGAEPIVLVAGEGGT